MDSRIMFYYFENILPALQQLTDRKIDVYEKDSGVSSHECAGYPKKTWQVFSATKIMKMLKNSKTFQSSCAPLNFSHQYIKAKTLHQPPSD